MLLGLVPDEHGIVNGITQLAETIESRSTRQRFEAKVSDRTEFSVSSEVFPNICEATLKEIGNSYKI